jgi:hypothetical protein
MFNRTRKPNMQRIVTIDELDTFADTIDGLYDVSATINGLDFLVNIWKNVIKPLNQ